MRQVSSHVPSCAPLSLLAAHAFRVPFHVGTDPVASSSALDANSIFENGVYSPAHRSARLLEIRRNATEVYLSRSPDRVVRAIEKGADQIRSWVNKCLSSGLPLAAK